MAEICLGGARKRENENNLMKCSPFFPELYEYFDLITNFIDFKKYLNSIMHHDLFFFFTFMYSLLNYKDDDK